MGGRRTPQTQDRLTEVGVESKKTKSALFLTHKKIMQIADERKTSRGERKEGTRRAETRTWRKVMKFLAQKKPRTGDEANRSL